MARISGFLTAALVALWGTVVMAQNVILPPGLDPENTIVLQLKDGPVVIETYPEDAPTHVARVKELTRQGFYDGLKFHRVIEGFMAQTGDPKGDGTGGSGQNLKAEFNKRLHFRGTVSMARADDPDSADSQFFICLQPSFALNNKYTVWGRVVSGMEAVDKIQRGEGPAFGDPDSIVKMSVAADLLASGQAKLYEANDTAAAAAAPVSAPASAPGEQPVEAAATPETTAAEAAGEPVSPPQP